MNFYTAKQIAEKWNLSVQQIRKYCKEGKIKSAIDVSPNVCMEMGDW